MRPRLTAPLLLATASAYSHQPSRRRCAAFRDPRIPRGAGCLCNGLGTVPLPTVEHRLGAPRRMRMQSIRAQPQKRWGLGYSLRMTVGDDDETDGTATATMPLHEQLQENILGGTEIKGEINGAKENLPDDTNIGGKINGFDDATSLEGLLEKVRSYCPDADLELISKAYHFAKDAHEGQLRKSGEPYFTHPVGVTHIIADMKLDVASVVTGLLHDTVEDTDVSLDSIESEFGKEIANLVDGVTKIGRIQFHSRQERQAENYRKMIVAMARDIRVILVKLADRTHNIRTLQYMSPNKQREIARETLELYAPLAHRLGIHRLKTELENTSLQYLHPEVYQQLQTMVAARQEQRQAYTDGVIAILEEHMANAGLKSATVTGRPKSLYSIYEKMKSQGLAFDEIQDLTAFRILVDDDVGQCYQALGAVHAMWKPVPGRFKDYIALPKPNGYQSLHTTVIGPGGKRIEVQIRTHSMHEVAEGGIAAHWMYKGENRGVEEARRFTWLRQLVDWVQQLNDPSEFVDSIKEDLFEKEVFVFSPGGQLFALAKGSSVLDFAYLIHSDLGNHCVGAKVNGKMVPLKHAVSNGDTVEIIKSANQTPTREWLDIVRTSKAKQRIRSWLKQQQRDESVALGCKLLERELKRKSSKRPNIDVMKEYKDRLNSVLSTFELRDEEHLLSALGYGQISASILVNEILNLSSKQSNRGLSKDEKGDELALQAIREKSVPPRPAALRGDGVIVGGERNVLINFCRNCSPLCGEDVKGVISRGRGIKIHRLGCKYLLESDEERRVDATWDEAAKASPRTVRLEVICEDTPGMLASMSRAISSLAVNIGSVMLKKVSNGRGIARFEVLLSTVDELHRVMNQLQQEQGVLSVKRR